MTQPARPHDTAPPPAAALSPAEITARSGSSFLTGFSCLDVRRREGMTAIYAFCRVADDAVDDASDAAIAGAHLAFWRAELAAAAAGRAATPVGRALQAAMERFGVAEAPLQALLDGIAMDLAPAPVADERALLRYCWHVASAVGIACLPVLGARGAEAERFADALGKALQLTNVLRDLRADAAAGRVYVPATWLADEGVDPAWIGGGAPAPARAPGGPMHRLVQRFAAAAWREFAAADAALVAMPRRTRRALVPARIMGRVYRELLRRLERRRGELPCERVRVPAARKACIAFAVLAGLRR